MSRSTEPAMSAGQASAMRTHIETKTVQTLMGLVSGMVADTALHDLEIAFLSTWLAEHPTVTGSWPGSAITSWVREVCADGVVTEQERSYLLGNLQALANTDFSISGSASAEPLQLPIDDSKPLALTGARVVHTGVFLFGTRARCERLSAELGAIPIESVTRATDVLVIGTRVSPSWATESYGRKIMAAMQLMQSGHPIQIVSEQHWYQHAQLRGHG